MKKLWEKIKERSKEPTSYAGLGLLLGGSGMILKSDEMAQIGDVVTNVGEPMARGDHTTALGMLLFGVLAIFMPERGKK